MPMAIFLLHPEQCDVRLAGDDHRFLDLVTCPDPMDFRVLLLRHAELLRSLHQWTIRVLFPQPFARGIPRFGHAAREALATPINPDTRTQASPR